VFSYILVGTSSALAPKFKVKTSIIICFLFLFTWLFAITTNIKVANIPLGGLPIIAGIIGAILGVISVRYNLSTEEEPSTLVNQDQEYIEEEPPYSRHTSMPTKLQLNPSKTKPLLNKYYYLGSVTLVLLIMLMWLVYKPNMKKVTNLGQIQNESGDNIEPTIINAKVNPYNSSNLPQMAPLGDYLSNRGVSRHEFTIVATGGSNYLLIETYTSGRYVELELFKERNRNEYFYLDRISLFGEEGGNLSSYPIEYNFEYQNFYSPPVFKIDTPCNYVYNEFIEINEDSFVITAQGNPKDIEFCLLEFCNSLDLKPLLQIKDDRGERKYLLNSLKDFYLLTRDIEEVEELYFGLTCNFENKTHLWNEIRTYITESE